MSIPSISVVIVPLLVSASVVGVVVVPPLISACIIGTVDSVVETFNISDPFATPSCNVLWNVLNILSYVVLVSSYIVWDVLDSLLVVVYTILDAVAVIVKAILDPVFIVVNSVFDAVLVVLKVVVYSEGQH